ncbi:MAG: hypothetical protein WBQ85_20785 [Candidatus Sulfotelmatobacter sp.]
MKVDKVFVSGARGVINPVVEAFQVPALRKVREGRGTHFIADASKTKELGGQRGQGLHSTYIRSIHQTRKIATMAPAM